MTTEELVKINKDYFKSVASAGLKTALLVYLPFLAQPPFPYVLDLFLDWFISKIADALEQASYFIYTDFRTSAQGKAYVEAKLKGYKAEIGGKIDEIKAANEEIKTAFRNFAKFNR